MAIISQSNPADFANRRQTYFSRELLKATEFNLRMAQFAQKKTLPANSGTLTIRFFRPRKARKGNGAGGTGPGNITEGTTTLRNSEVGVGYVDCALNQRGDDFTITDIVKATDILDTLQLYTKTVGADAALDFDSICQNAIFADATTNVKALNLGLGAAQTTLFNSNATWGKPTAKYFERFAGVANTGVSATDFTSLTGLSAANSKFTRVEHLRALTQLRANDVHPKDGKVYPVIVPPEIMHDIRQDTTLVSAMTYRDTKALYNYEQFELDGGAFIESTNPWIEKNTYGTYDNTGNIFGLLYLGDEAFGVPRLSSNVAGGDPTAPKMIILDTPDKSDPYNQRVVGAWKCLYGAILIVTSEPSDVPRVVALRCKTTFA